MSPWQGYSPSKRPGLHMGVTNHLGYLGWTSKHLGWTPKMDSWNSRIGAWFVGVHVSLCPKEYFQVPFVSFGECILYSSPRKRASFCAKILILHEDSRLPFVFSFSDTIVKRTLSINLVWQTSNNDFIKGIRRVPFTGPIPG